MSGFGVTWLGVERGMKRDQGEKEEEGEDRGSSHEGAEARRSSKCLGSPAGEAAVRREIRGYPQ